MRIINFSTFFLLLALTACTPSSQSNRLVNKESVSPTPKEELVNFPQEQPALTAIEAIKEVEQSKNFWLYLTDSFLLNDNIDQASVRRSLTWLEQHPEYTTNILEQAKPLLYYIASQIEEKQLPLELLLLPIVESGYDHFAYSYADAAGIWQLTPATANRLGVNQTWWYDGRRDIQDSTSAAMDYLKFLHNYFKGDWLLAVAAYNSGEGTVSRAVRYNKSKGLPADFWHLNLPKQTKYYVPKWLALCAHMKNIVANEALLAKLPEIINESTLSTVTLEQQFSLKDIAQLAGSDLDTIHHFNPGLNQWVTPPDSEHTLLLPKEQAEKLKVELKNKEPKEAITWHRYQIQPGDSLSVISQKFNVPTSIVKTLNGLSDSKIIAGKKLLIPTNGNKSSLPEGSNKASDHKNTLSITVKSGDNLWTLAKKYQTTVDKIIKDNQLEHQKPLKIGKKLIIKRIISLDKSFALRNQFIRKIFYPIRKGDSVAKIAQRFHLTTNDVIHWNPKIKNNIHPGQVITLFVDVTKQTI